MKEETTVKGSKLGKTESIRKFGTENFDELQEFPEIATALNFFIRTPCVQTGTWVFIKGHFMKMWQGRLSQGADKAYAFPYFCSFFVEKISEGVGWRMKEK